MRHWLFKSLLVMTLLVALLEGTLRWFGPEIARQVMTPDEIETLLVDNVSKGTTLKPTVERVRVRVSLFTGIDVIFEAPRFELDSGPFMSAHSLVGSVSLGSLFTSQPALNRLELKQPTVLLSKDLFDEMTLWHVTDSAAIEPGAKLLAKDYRIEIEPELLEHPTASWLKTVSLTGDRLAWDGYKSENSQKIRLKGHLLADTQTSTRLDEPFDLQAQFIHRPWHTFEQLKASLKLAKSSVKVNGQVWVNPNQLDDNQVVVHALGDLQDMAHWSQLLSLYQPGFRLVLDGKSTFDLNWVGPINAQSLQMASLNPYVRANGTLSFHNTKFGTLGAPAMVLKDLSGQFVWEKDWLGQTLKTKGVKVALNGALSQPITVNGTLLGRGPLSVKADKLALSTVYDALLNSWPLLSPALKQVVYTMVWQGQTSMDFRYDPNQPFRGQIQITKAALFYRQPDAHIALLQEIQGRLTVSKEGAMQPVLSGKLKSSPFSLQGVIDPAGNKVNLTFNAPDLKLNDVEELANRLHLAQALPINKTGGELNVAMNWTGSLKEPTLEGKIGIEKAQGQFKQVQGVAFNQLNGSLVFADQQLRLDQVKGYVNDLPLQVKGFVGLQDGSYDINLLGQQLPLAKVVNLLKEARFFPEWSDEQTTQDIFAEIDTDEPSGTLLQEIKANVAKEVTSKAALVMNNTVESKPAAEASNPNSATSSPPDANLPSASSKPIQSQPEPVEEIPVSKHPAVAPKSVALVNAPLLRRMEVRSGLVDLDVHWSSKQPETVGGEVRASNVSLEWPGPSQPIPVKIQTIRYELASGQLEVGPNKQISVIGIPMTLSGWIQDDDFELSVGFQDLPTSWIRDNETSLRAVFPWFHPQIYQAKGQIDLAMTASPTENEWKFGFDDVGISTAYLKFPLYDLNGNLAIKADGGGWVIDSENLSLRYANSPMTLFSHIQGRQDIFVEAKGTLSPLLLNNLIAANNSNLLAYAEVPFDITVSGKLGELKGKGLGNDLSVFFDVNPTSLLAKQPEPENADPNQTKNQLHEVHWSSVFHLKENQLILEKTTFGQSEGSQIALSGVLSNLFEPIEASLLLTMKTSPVLDLAVLSKQINHPVFDTLQGKVQSDMQLSVTPTISRVDGMFAVDGLQSQPLGIYNLTGNMTFEGQQGKLNVASLQLPGVDGKLTADIAETFLFPFPLDNVDAQGKQVIVPLFSLWLDQVVNKTIRRDIWQRFFPTNRFELPTPFVVDRGKVDFEEMIVGNLIVNHFQSPIKMYANAYMELEGFQGESAGGIVKGNFSLQPKHNNFMTAHLDIDQMQANAVTQTLLGVTNELFGQLSGTIDFTTEGETQDEMMNRANGIADLKIHEGRMPSVSNVERLLVAANTISGGLANLNLNSLFRIATPLKSDYFADTEGTFKIAQGVAYTGDTHINGKDLDLFVQGSSRLIDGYSDLTIRGEMKRDVSGAFGEIGKLSFGRVLGIIPPLRKIVGWIPGIGFTPGFGGPRGGEGLAFELSVKGPVSDPASLQDFRWAR